MKQHEQGRFNRITNRIKQEIPVKSSGKMNKRGWIKIVEAFVAVIIVFAGLMIVLQNQPQFAPTTEEELTGLESHILDQIALNDNLRAQVLSDGEKNKEGVIEILEKLIPNGYSFDVAICHLGDVCPSNALPYLKKDVYVEERIIAANLTAYNPKLVRLFVWRGNWPEEYCPTTTCKSAEQISRECSDDYTIRQKQCATFKHGDKQCLKWTDWQDAEDCSAQGDYVCQSGECVEAAAREAALTLRFSGTVYSWDSSMKNHKYTHTRTFTESGGVGITLTQGQLCYQSTGSCDPKGTVNYRINANSNLITTNNYFHTPTATDKFTLKYWGTDDKGNAVYVEQKMCVSGASFTENC